MPSSQCLEESHGADLLDCIAELTSLLEQAVRETKNIKDLLPSPSYSCLLSDPPIYALSDPLRHTLLCESPAISGTDTLLSFIRRHRDSIAHGLETVSLRCIACYLLKSSTDDGLELGLYLLLDEPQYLGDSGSMNLQRNVPMPSTVLRLVQANLAQKLHTIFTDDTASARAKRMAGKVLVELLYEPEMDSQICEELNNNGCLRPIVSVLNDSDIVLSCFSSTILQRFHPSKAQSNPAWELNGSDSGKFDMIQSKGSPVEQYYSYMRAKGKPPLNGIGVGRRPCTLGEPLYYLLESEGKETELLPQGSILLGMGTGRLDFVLCRKDSMGWVFDYMTLRTMKRSRTRCIIFNAAGGQKPLLSFHINAGDSLTVNDQERSLEAFSLRMTTADDLAGLRRGLEAMGIRSQIRRTRASPSVPRPSSLMIPLDNTDYIAQKSSGFSDPPTEEAIGHAVHSVRWGNELSNLIAQASRVSETGSENLSQSALTELTRTPPAYESSPSRDRNISHPVDLKPIPESGQTDKGSPCEPNIPLESSKNGEESVRGSKYVGSLGETRPRNEREASWTGPASNTRSRRSQNGTMPPANTLSKPMLPNTQESLIFPERRSRGKLYTAQTKTVMNRVEDLRTSNSYAEREVHADTELTSATSPLPGASGSTFNRNSKKQSSGAKKRKSAAKAKEQSKGKGRGKGCTNESAKPLPLPTDTNATDDSRKGGHVKVLVEDAGQTIEADRHETCDSPVPGLSDMLNHLHHALKPIPSISQAFHISVPQDRATPNDTVVYGPHSLVESENANDRIHAFGYPNDGQCLGENHQGRGQTVAEKLIAAFGESSTVQPREQSKATCPNEKEGVEIVRHSPRSQKVNSDDGLRVNTLLHVEDEKPDMPGSSAANMTLQGASVYEPSPHVSSTGTQKRSLQATKSDSLNWILGKRNAASGLESKYDRKRTRRTSSLLTSSSVEPRSTQSAVESAQTSSQGQTGREDRVLEQPLENAVSPFASIKISGLPDAEETSDEIPIHDTGGNGHMPSVRPRGGNGQPRSDRTGEALNSSSKTIVDEDGSPRLLHRGKNGQSSSKRGELFHNGEQQSAVQRRNVSYKAKGAQGAEDGPFAVVCERGDAGPEGETAKPTDGPNADANVVDNASYSTVSGRNESSIMNGDGPTSGVLQSVPDQSSKTQEQSFRGENSDRCPKEHLSVDRLFGGGAASDHKPECRQSTDVPVQFDRQTLLQALDRGLERTLLSNNEHLSRQIESERAEVDEVLEGYLDQYRTALNWVLEKQKERIRLYKQQVESIIQQHAGVCQDLIRRLQEDEKSLSAV